MKLVSRFKKLIACAILIAFIPSQAWAQGITVPVGSSLNINTGQLTVPGNITNAGTLTTTTGPITLTGNWTNSGTFNAGTGTVNFSGASGTETLNSGGVGAADTFYNLTHNTAGTVQLNSNALNVNENFTNTSGTFNANSLNMTVDGNWENAAAFTPGTNLVTLNGTNQWVTGTTAFYGFSKTIPSGGPYTLTFDATSGAIQEFTNNLTLQGNATNDLFIATNIPNTQANIALAASGSQSIANVNVNYSNAAGVVGFTGQTLVARTSTDSGHNTNWDFNNASITWVGGASGDTTDWNNPANWAPMLVPAAGDSVIITGATATEPNLCPNPHSFSCSATVTIANLTVGSGVSASSASLALSGVNLTVTAAFSNNGTVYLDGNETLKLTMDTTHGTFAYVGEGGNSQATPTLSICTSPNPGPSTCSSNVVYNNLTIDDTNPTVADQDIFKTNGTLAVNNNLTITSGTLDISANSDTMTVTNLLSVNGANGILTATNGNIAANGSVSITAGTFTAPGSGKTFTVTGNFAHTGGTFTHSNGLVTLNGNSQTVTGTTTFYGFSKVVSSGGPYTLTFDATSGAIQEFTNNLTLQGNATNDLFIATNTPNTQADIALSTAGTQSIFDVNVNYSNAAGIAGFTGQALVARTSTDSGHNTNWEFNNASVTWVGGASGDTTDWSNPANWAPMVVPGAGDSVVIPGGTTYEPVLTSNVTVGALTVGSGASASTATLTLNGHNLTVNTSSSGTGILTNNGTIKLLGPETVTVTTINTNAGTFEYDGDNTGSTYNITNLLTVTNPANYVYYNLTIDDTHVTPDNFTIGTDPLNVYGNLSVQAGSLDLSGSSTVKVTGAVTISNGATLKAPSAVTATAFTVGGNWTDNGTFNNSNGEVNFNPTTTSIISGNTTFYNFYSNAAGKTIQITAGSTQTISHTFSLLGVIGNLITLDSTGAPWNLALSSTQTVTGVNVEGSDATNIVTCQDCVDSHNNTDWVFETLSITSPASSTTVGTTPTIIGTANPNSTVYIRDISNNLVATAKSDTNGNFRVVVGQDAAATGLVSNPPPQLAAGANSLTPYLTSALINPGLSNSITVTSSTPPVTQVPVISTLNGINITNPTADQNITGGTLTIGGSGAVGESVTVQALSSNGTLILSAASGAVAGNGTYSVSLNTSTIAAANYLSVTVGTSNNETTSALIQISLTDPYGVVYTASNNQPIQGATVTLYSATTKQAATGVQSCNMAGVCTSGAAANPFTTLADGFYSFLAPPGQYYLGVSAGGYTFPSKIAAVPAGRSVGIGSKGQTFTVGAQVFELDLPMDGNSSLLHITKVANKSEASVGDIVMYTVNIQNLSATNTVNSVYLNDQIPPGFKYIKDRVLLNGSPTSEPSGQRPLIFNIGTVAPSTTIILQYQLVIGTGVTMGTYRNTATAQFSGGDVISNPAQASVKIIPDPIFDLGGVIGKVFFDWNENGIQDAPYYDSVSHETVVEKPVPNVQIIMEDGTIITTDRDGKFNIPGLLPGRHLFRLDERTLPPGAYLTTDKGVIVDVTAGSISKVNFGVNIDETQTKGRDAVFFNEKLRLTQDRNRPVPRLNAAIFNASADAKADTEEVVLNEGALVRQAEFRIFTNYSPFISSWHLNIMDADTRKTVKSFDGTPLNINDPIYWNGRDDQDIIISPDHKYSYVLSVTDSKNNTDDTKEKPITVREIKDDADLKKEREETKDILKDRADRYRKWLDAQGAVNNVDHQLIPVQGETIHIDRQGTDVKSIHVMKGNQLFTDLPLTQQYGLTPDELIAGGFSTADEKDNLEIILPNGDYSLDVVSIKPCVDPPGNPCPSTPTTSTSTPPGGGAVSRNDISVAPGPLEHYSRPLKVGDDYIMFVALGDAQVGYNIDRGNIEPIQDATEEPGFYHEGKGAFYLKGQILGKYLITSSYDSDRAQKALFRQLDPNTYYPVYGDQSSINYDAADTQGALYLKVEWDKSSAILGNYAVDFNDTEFSAFSRAYYGGKIDYQSVATNPYGDARTKIVVYHAQTQQLPSHNEFLATGGSLYFLKYKNVVQGSDTVVIQVRDQTTGLVVASQTMVNGADYELDNGQGRILFWQPVAMIAQSENIISNNLINGDPIYVVIDYQYAVSGLQMQGSQGGRVAQAVGDNVVLGGTYVQDNSSGQNYTLEGTDATLHVTKDDTVKAEYAQTTSQDQSSYVSTDGGITFTSLNLSGTASGKAYGITGDARLFDNIGLKSYYKWIDANFGATSDTSGQGTQKMGLAFTWDMTPVTRLTASEDIQRLLAGGNLQTSTQVGASETDTTMVQIVHTQERLKMTGQFQLVETKNVIDGIESTTNQRGATFGGQAQYDLTPRIKVTLGQQLDVINQANTATTLGVADRVTDQTTLNALETVSSQGHALTAGLTNQIGKRIALTTDYTLTNLNTGEIDKTVSVGVTDQVTKNITTTGTVAQTASSIGTTTTTASIGTQAKISDNMSLAMNVGKSQNSLGQSTDGGTSVNLNGTTQIGNTTVTGLASASAGTPTSDALGIGTTGVTTTTSYGVTATTKVNENTTTNGSLTIANETTGHDTTTVGFGNTSKLDQELQAVTANSFSFSPDNGTTNSSKYSLVRNVNGAQSEADFTKESDILPGSVSESNIFGLTGDVNDKVALNGSVESGKVQNLDGTQTNRTDFTLGSGYVLKDTETAVERLKNSIKVELRLDRGIGTDTLHQFVLYDAIDGKITDNWSVNAKLDYSKTLDTTTGAVAERHQEIILGMAYRPVNFDNLNLITEFSSQDGYAGGTQQADALNTNVNQTKAQVFSAEAIYDINDKWQLAEKAAFRIESEQDATFAFTQTHTWLVINRLNYKIDRNWTISGELRDLVQVEAKDSKQGILLQASRDINANTQLTIGWNFTNYTDDLTNLSYSSLGPFIRMDGKFYDETPEERARARAKWMDAKIDAWAWAMIRKEFSKKDSKIVLELNRLFILAKKSRAAGNLEESRQIYKDIITAGQMMYNEASEYIRGRIAFEEQLQQLYKTGHDYFRGGEYVKARKIWEKVVDDASKGVVK